VTLLITGATVMLTSADSPIKSVKELIAVAKREPRQAHVCVVRRGPHLAT
jgi:hypothetical protein